MKRTIIQEKKDPSKNGRIAQIMDEYAKKQPGDVDAQVYKYRLYDDNENLIGGIDFVIHAEWLYIDEFAVVENLRKQGYGKQILKEVEDFGKSKGCTQSSLMSFNYSAPEFYKKCGYELKYTLEFKDSRSNYNLLEKHLA